MIKGHCCGGYLTVYMTITLGVILTLSLTMIEGARRSAMRMEAELVTDTAMRSLFAEYNRELMRQYNIFAIDSSYGSSVSGTGRASEHFKEYMEKNYERDVPMPWLDNRDLIGAYPESALVVAATYLTDDSGRIFRECAVDAVRDDLGLAIAGEVVALATSAEIRAADSMDVAADMGQQASEVGETADSERRSRESTRASEEWNYELACREAAANGEPPPAAPELTDVPEEYRSPVSSVAETVNTGILGLLTDDVENLSRRQLDLNGIVSGRAAAGNINTGTILYEPDEKGPAEEALDKALFGEYLMRYMGRYGDVCEDDAMWYQIEYLIAGKSADAENLNSVALKIVAIRAGMDMLYLESDSAKKAEAASAATLICTACMIEWMIPVLTHVLLLAWALLEARYDTSTLLSGGKIPFMKTSADWHCDLQSVIEGRAAGRGGDSGTGLSYTDYLRIFLFMTDTADLTMRAMDMIEADIRLSRGNSLFRMDACMEMIECSAVLESPFGSRITIKRKLKY